MSKQNAAKVVWWISALLLLLWVLPLVVAWGWDVDTESYLQQIQLYPSWRQWLRTPWSLLSYLLFHNGFAHLCLNLFLLIQSGTFLQRWGLSSHAVLWLFGLGGIAGGLFFMMGMELIDWIGFSVLPMPLRGSSAAVTALLVAALSAYLQQRKQQETTLATGYKILFIGLIVVWLLLTGNNVGGHLAHLGGGLLGWVAWGEFRRRHLRLAQLEKQKTEAINKASRSGYRVLSTQEKELIIDANHGEKRKK